MLDLFHLKFIQNTSRTFAFVSADHQVWIKMWKQRSENNFRVFSNSGKEGTGVALDGWNELVCYQVT
jgi:hypothetical protein